MRKDVEQLYKELLNRQLKTVIPTKRLQVNDLKRIAKKISSSLFDENECSLWMGYVTNINNLSKGAYVNFYFKKKKVALHRLLYSNFISDIDDEEYLKFNCANKGKCCNIHHMNKFRYNTCIDAENRANARKDSSDADTDSSSASVKSADFVLDFD